MLSNLKKSVKKNKSDLFFIISIILVALFSFGLGRLTAPVSSDEPIIIEDLSSSAMRQTTEILQLQEVSEGEIRLVASKNGTKYHHPDCVWAQKISPENLITFSSEKEAREAGYTPCSSFDKYSQ